MSASAVLLLGLPVQINAKPLPRLTVSGQFFGTETGERFTAIECSDFNLLARYLDGEDIRPVLRNRVGFNMLRVWTLMQLSQYGIGDLTLDMHPDLYERIPDFCRLCGSFGFYIEFTAYTGINDPNHWERLGEAVKGCSNVILELVNELDQNTNEPDSDGRIFDLSLYDKIDGVLCSHGSNGSEHWPVEPYWDYTTMHFNDAHEWQRKVGHNAWEIWLGPTLSNENTRPDKDGAIWHFEDAAEGAALLCAGSCFHSQSGKASTVFSAQDAQFAQAWLAGAQSVPLRYQPGAYRHGQDEIDVEHDEHLLRVYQRVLSDGDGWMVKIRNGYA